MNTVNCSTIAPSPVGHQEANVVCRDALEGVLRKGAQAILQAAVENEVDNYTRTHRHYRDANGHRQVVRNGYFPARKLQTGLGSVPIKQPRIDDRRPGKRFASTILPPYLRRVSWMDALIPAVYLRGVSMSEMHDTLVQDLGGEAASFLSSASVAQLEKKWRLERKQWNERDLSSAKYAHLWADGICYSVGRSHLSTYVVVIVGALMDGTKELIVVSEGRRETKSAWKKVFEDLKQRRLKIPSKIRIAKEVCGFLEALEEEYTGIGEHGFWVQRSANILKKLPATAQHHAKKYVHEIYMAENRRAALDAYTEFLRLYEAKYPRACACLKIDTEAFLTVGGRSTGNNGSAFAPSESRSHLLVKSDVVSSGARMALSTIEGF